MSTVNLVSPLEEQELRILETLILDKTAQSQQRAVEILSRHLTNCFNIGADDAFKETGDTARVLAVNTKSLTTLVAEEVAPALNEAYGFMARDLTDIINNGIRENLTAAQISSSLEETLRTTFGEQIHFDRVGQTKKAVEVLPSGKMRLIEQKIKRPYTAKVGNYADVLARTNVKDAYALGHTEGYKSAGLESWRYSSAGDERTRPRHLALHGEVYVIGSEQEGLALQVMGEALCRCRPTAFFDDPKRDTPKEVFQKQKQDRANIWLDEKANNTVGREIARKDSFKVKGRAMAGMKDPDTKIMTTLAGTNRSKVVTGKIQEFQKSFVSSGQVQHIYKKHIGGNNKITFNDIMGMKGRPPQGYSKAYNNFMVLNEKGDMAIFKNRTNKIITGHDVNKRTLGQLKKKYQDEL